MSDPSLPAAPLPGLLRRIPAVFLSPGKLFEQLRHAPAWGGAVLVVAILSVAAMALLPAELFEDQMRQALQRSGAEESEISVETMVAVTRFSTIAAAGLGSVGFAFLMAAIMLLAFATLLGDDGRYRQYLAVIAHAMIVPAVGALLLLPLRIAQDDLELVLSVGTFLPFLEEGPLRSYLNALDLFALWAVMLTALGVSKIQPSRAWGGAFAILAIVWLVFSGGMAALSSLGS